MVHGGGLATLIGPKNPLLFLFFLVLFFLSFIIFKASYFLFFLIHMTRVNTS
jgi:hypothetical protein